MNVHGIVPAAGSGTRMGPGRPKQFRLLAGEPILAHTVGALARSGRLSSLTLAVAADEIELVGREILPCAGEVPVQVIEGGADRQASVWNALQALEDPKPEDVVLVHDGVRPLVTGDVIAAVIDGAVRAGAATCGVPAKDTIKLVGDGNVVELTLERSRCYHTQTPQAFRYAVLLEAHERALAEVPEERGTDDAGLAERIGHKVVMTPGLYENLKITTPEDLAVAELLAPKFFPKGSKSR